MPSLMKKEAVSGFSAAPPDMRSLTPGKAFWRTLPRTSVSRKDLRPNFIARSNNNLFKIPLSLALESILCFALSRKNGTAVRNVGADCAMSAHLVGDHGEGVVRVAALAQDELLHLELLWLRGR